MGMPMTSRDDLMDAYEEYLTHEKYIERPNRVDIERELRELRQDLEGNWDGDD